MNLKSFFLVAAFFSATTALCPADSYTINLVAGDNLIANHLDNGSNTLDEIIPAPPENTTLYKFNGSGYTSVNFSADNPGWSGDLTLNPGEGAILSLDGSQASTFDLTLTGTPHVPVLPIVLRTGFNLVSCQTNAACGYAQIVGAPPVNGTVVYKFNPGSGHSAGNFAAPDYSLFTYTNGGWLPSAPVAGVGEAVWINVPSVAAVCGPLQIKLAGIDRPGNVILTWLGSSNCFLQAAPALADPASASSWTGVPGTSPLVLPALTAKRFFRTVSVDGSNFSPNIVGYVNLTLPSSPGGGGSTALIANPLNGTNNNLSTILPLPDAADGTSISRFDPATQTYRDPVTFFAGFGWFSGGPPEDYVLNPGEGFWIYPAGPSPLTITFVGDVPQGSLSNSIPGPNLTSLRSSIVPLALPLGDGATPGTLKFPAVDGDEVLTWDTAMQVYHVYDFIEGVGWDDGSGAVSSGPTIPVATGFVVNRAGPAVTWTQSFNPGCAPPTITVQPQSQTTNGCRCVTFSVVATGTAPFTYQWQCNGVNITGATTSSYTKCPVALTDNGNSYRVVIGNPCGSATSADAVLTVVDTIPPVLHCPTSDIVVQGATPGAVVNYPIGAGDCSPNIVVVCAPPSGTIFPCGTTTVTCQASDPSGNSSTCSFRAIVLCDCLTLLNERLSCANGAMNYAFTLQNNSGVPVKNLFLVPKTNCFSVNPDVFTFKPLLATGQSTNLSTTINLTGGCSTNLCFLVVALNSNGVVCCSVMHCVNRSLAAPRLTGASAACGGNKITATFNEPLDPASALNLANYIVDDFTHHLSLLVTSVAFGADSKTICLYTAATLAAGTQFRLTVNNVTDLCGNAIAPNTLLNFGCPSKLNMTFASGMLCMSWTGEAVLETTSSLTPPIAWAAAANQTNPQCILPSGPQKFFRIRGN